MVHPHPGRVLPTAWATWPWDFAGDIILVGGHLAGQPPIELELAIVWVTEHEHESLKDGLTLVALLNIGVFVQLLTPVEQGCLHPGAVAPIVGRVGLVPLCIQEFEYFPS